MKPPRGHRNEERREMEKIHKHSEREIQSILKLKYKKIEETLIHGGKYFTQKHVTKNYGPKLERKKKNAVK